MSINWENVEYNGCLSAPLDKRLMNIKKGHESFFTDEEAAEVLQELRENYRSVNVTDNCPRDGYTRISAW